MNTDNSENNECGDFKNNLRIQRDLRDLSQEEIKFKENNNKDAKAKDDRQDEDQDQDQQDNFINQVYSQEVLGTAVLKTSSVQAQIVRRDTSEEVDEDDGMAVDDNVLDRGGSQQQLHDEDDDEEDGIQQDDVDEEMEAIEPVANDSSQNVQPTQQQNQSNFQRSEQNSSEPVFRVSQLSSATSVRQVQGSNNNGYDQVVQESNEVVQSQQPRTSTQLQLVDTNLNLNQSIQLQTQSLLQQQHQQFQKYVDNIELSDLLIQVANKQDISSYTEFHCHKLILAMTSPFFKTQLYNQHWSLQQGLICPRVIRKQKQQLCSLEVKRAEYESIFSKKINQFQDIKIERQKKYTSKKQYTSINDSVDLQTSNSISNTNYVAYQDASTVSEEGNTSYSKWLDSHSYSSFEERKPKSQQKKIDPKVNLIISINKIDCLTIHDCHPNDFRLFLHYCYDHSLQLENLVSVDQAIRLSELAERFLCQELQQMIAKFMRKKFSTIYAFKIYLWAVKYQPNEGQSFLQNMEEYIYQNYQLVFFKGVFQQAQLLLDTKLAIKLIVNGAKHCYVKTKNKIMRQNNADKSDQLVSLIYERAKELASQVSEPNSKNYKEIIMKCLKDQDLSLLSSKVIMDLIQLRVMTYEQLVNCSFGYFKRKRDQKARLHRNKYVEVSEKIRKVTYNTDYFDRNKFESRSGQAFHFNSGRIGKFIECEFEKPLKICRSRLTTEQDANVTFVIQCSKRKEDWTTVTAFRQLKGERELTWKNSKPYKFWRIVLVDHSGNLAWYKGITWFVKSIDYPYFDNSVHLSAQLFSRAPSDPAPVMDLGIEQQQSRQSRQQGTAEDNNENNDQDNTDENSLRYFLQSSHQQTQTTQTNFLQQEI